MSVAGVTCMTTLAEMKSRHAARKLRDAPLNKILGPDKSSEDFDALLAMIDSYKDLLREVHVFLRNNPKKHDELFDELVTKVGEASE